MLGSKEDHRARLMYTLQKAGKAVLVCGFTTACSFLANTASWIRPVREFGAFMGTCVLAQLVLAVCVYPLILVQLTKTFRPEVLEKSCLKRKQDVLDPGGLESANQGGYQKARVTVK